MKIRYILYLKEEELYFIEKLEKRVKPRNYILLIIPILITQSFILQMNLLLILNIVVYIFYKRLLKFIKVIFILNIFLITIFCYCKFYLETVYFFMFVFVFYFNFPFSVFYFFLWFVSCFNYLFFIQRPLIILYWYVFKVITNFELENQFFNFICTVCVLVAINSSYNEYVVNNDFYHNRVYSFLQSTIEKLINYKNI